ncbi:tungsten ABC transporter substrate-binding protein [Mesobacillus campisalis]|uniref:Tungsten ABC transporter substrate-binding protein n=1 Tax=Mesobacillus campisalis TaxID=1408103 RepID=A0A0M2SYZ7_9BACI|nr:substrate-binding domain-containing protein [Mesobacillus campisalis]KKK39378.1 tungsten ABC transporter substrate-binding protein [Mesobacillus campisalis]
MFKIKRAFAIMLIMLVALMAACSSSTGNDATKDEPKESGEVERTDIILATTTSTQDSGLLDVLIPMFEEQQPYNVKTVAVGTGQALEMGSRGEADALLVHAPDAEQELVDSEDVVNRQKIMYNDFIIVGPADDPAGIKDAAVAEALTKAFDAKATFVSRGDDSGTHKKELALWKEANLDPAENGSYVETGQGMGSSLQVAAEKKGYILTDRATYLAQKDNLGDFEIMVEGDESLLNIYHVMEVNAEKHEKVKKDGAKAFVEFMIAEDTKKTIADFGVEEYGEPLFFLFE